MAEQTRPADPAPPLAALLAGIDDLLVRDWLRDLLAHGDAASNDATTGQPAASKHATADTRWAKK